MTEARVSLPAGLCASCRHAGIVRSQRSVFLRCALAGRDGRYERYPTLPVAACPGFDAAVTEEPAERARGD